MSTGTATCPLDLELRGTREGRRQLPKPMRSPIFTVALAAFAGVANVFRIRNIIRPAISKSNWARHDAVGRRSSPARGHGHWDGDGVPSRMGTLQPTGMFLTRQQRREAHRSRTR